MTVSRHFGWRGNATARSCQTAHRRSGPRARSAHFAPASCRPSAPSAPRRRRPDCPAARCWGIPARRMTEADRRPAAPCRKGSRAGETCLLSPDVLDHGGALAGACEPGVALAAEQSRRPQSASMWVSMSAEMPGRPKMIRAAGRPILRSANTRLPLRSRKLLISSRATMSTSLWNSWARSGCVSLARRPSLWRQYRRICCRV
jgi:hypothetical protein